MLNILFARHKGKKWKVFDSADLVPTPPPLHFMATSFNLLVLEIFQTADFVKKTFKRNGSYLLLHLLSFTSLTYYILG